MPEKNKPQAPTLNQKLHAIMSEVGILKKDKRNDFHKYDYLSEEAIKKAIQPLLIKHGVLFSISLKSVRHKDNLTTVGLKYSFTDVKTGETKTRSFYGDGEDKGDKGIYKAITGAIKYILTSTFLVPTGDDPEKETAPRRSTIASKASQGPKRYQASTPPAKKPKTGEFGEPLEQEESEEEIPVIDADEPSGPPAEYECHECGRIIREMEKDYSLKFYGKQLCRSCQRGHKKIKQ